MKLTKRGKRVRALLIALAIFAYVTVLISEPIYGDCEQTHLGWTCKLQSYNWWWNK